MTNDSTPDEQPVPDDPDAERDESTSRWRTSRRSVLGAAAATGIGAGFAGAGFAQEQATTIQLVGVTPGWQYEGDPNAPYIAGDTTPTEGTITNPTFQFQPGQEYEVTWTNGDGQPHDFDIQDADGNTIVDSELLSEQGATQTVTFTASEEMAQYICTVHPNTMVGDIQVGGGGTGTMAGMQEDGFFAQGTEVGFQTVAEGMTAPTDFAVADEDQDRYFVADQTGELWVVTPDGGRQDEPFVDVSDRMVELGTFYGSYATQGQSYDERGLLGVEFHPEFQENGRFYLHYSAPPTQELQDRGWDHIEMVSEFQASDDLSGADPNSEAVLLAIPSPQYNHDAGAIAFGPDDYLYVPMGDGGGANDDMYGHVDDWYGRNAGGNGQDVTQNMLGDVLRIDVEGSGAGPQGNYGIPEDNPFAGEDNPGIDEIYAYGFRNPYGVSFDSQGNFFVADAGQDLWEEADIVERGGNYGWNVKEGTHCFSTENPSQVGAITDCPDSEPDEAPYDGSQLQDPIVEFPHQYQGQSVGITIVGGHRYEADTISGLTGDYVYGIWTSDPSREAPDGRVLTATPPEGFDEGGTATSTPTGTETGMGTPTGTATGTDAGGGQGDVPRDRLWEMRELVFADGFPFFVRMFGRDTDGELYVLVSQVGVPEGDTGRVLRIVPPEEGETPPETGTPAGTETETGGPQTEGPAGKTTPNGNETTTTTEE
ncbi:PQQ-dependent sugar dehydrogenase (plasmid) [Halorarum halophilum]|uniref:PQQ-dependent sugar dehydrogenase n=1 Tax=Halorarum halophilum TaxID=2743090 RepID=A0A7D5H3C5_9EURY|nr:PQQ-dependent sugar dehydrogenase [Halobaculum halophilum]QLG29653.1 PQQ-dependent sugar dehydrogenase [Halobaculum halophilum]